MGGKQNEEKESSESHVKFVIHSGQICRCLASWRLRTSFIAQVTFWILAKSKHLIRLQLISHILAVPYNSGPQTSELMTHLISKYFFCDQPHINISPTALIQIRISLEVYVYLGIQLNTVGPHQQFGKKYFIEPPQFSQLIFLHCLWML